MQPETHGGIAAGFQDGGRKQQNQRHMCLFHIHSVVSLRRSMPNVIGQNLRVSSGDSLLLELSCGFHKFFERLRRAKGRRRESSGGREEQKGDGVSHQYGAKSKRTTA
jgi:hypothetical protein